MYGEGKLIEGDLLGRAKLEMKELENLHEVKTYLPYKAAVEYVKTHQRGDPYNPKRFFPKHLRDGLKETFSIEHDDQIAFYTAVDSALDHFHGIDAFFEFEIGDGSNVRVTIDITTNPHKDSYKADVILLVPEHGLDTSDISYKETIEGYVEEIKEALLTKVKK